MRKLFLGLVFIQNVCISSLWAGSAYTVKYFLLTQLGYSDNQYELFLEAQEKMNITTQDFLDGNIFSSEPYSEAEKKQILIDLQKVLIEQFSGVQYNNNPQYVSTAGAPAVGKTVFLESIYGKNPKNAIYIEPDQVGLNCISQYHIDVQAHGSGYAYSKWRDASNFISNFMLVKACVEKKNIIHGTTSTSERVSNIYQFLKEIGYETTVNVLFATKLQRIAALRHRSKDIIQVAMQDFEAKSLLVLDRVIDSYLPYCDRVNFYFQKGNYWLGKGELVRFAEFSRKGDLLKIIADGGTKFLDERLVERIVA